VSSAWIRLLSFNFIEKHPSYLALLPPFFEALDRGDMQVVASTLTLTEVLVHPYRDGNQTLAEQYFDTLLNARNLRTVPLSPAMRQRPPGFGPLIN
jgi:hypothetical protein